MGVRRYLIVVSATATVATAASLLIRAYFRRGFDDGLDSVVSFSARLIAAARAEETERDDAYVRDPLAVVLAGKKAVKDRKAAFAKGQQAIAAAPEGDPESGGEERRPITRIVFRTVFFDQAIQTAVGLPHTPLSAELRTALGTKICTQVVLLGSGMDSRPWRLRLPTGVAWFEVDRSDVLRAKRRLLERAGAAFAAEEGSVRAGHPLCCSSWAGVPLDLQEAGWAEELKAKGFRPSQPTVWVLEGLLYYLEPDSVPAMLKEAASVSAAGSVLVASIVSAAFIEELKQKEVYRNKDSIMSGWKWGCPGDPKAYFGGSGWQVLSHPVWTSAAEAGGYRADRSIPSRSASTTAIATPSPGPALGSKQGQGNGGVQYVVAIVPV